MLPGLCKLGFASNSAKPFFGSLSGARLRANGILTAYEKNLTEVAWQPERIMGYGGAIQSFSAEKKGEHSHGSDRKFFIIRSQKSSAHKRLGGFLV
jgi:hypothetical protein